MSDAPTLPAEVDTALDRALSDLVGAVDTDLASVTPTSARSAEFDAALAEAKKFSSAGRAWLLTCLARRGGLVNVERAAWRVYELYREREERGSQA